MNHTWANFGALADCNIVIENDEFLLENQLQTACEDINLN